MGLSTPGIGSGLDIKGMVDVFVKKDTAIAQGRHDKQFKRVDAEISTLGKIQSSLSTLETTLSNLSNMSQFYKMKSSLSSPGYFSATVTDQAKPGVYQIQVQALAQSQNLASGYFASNSTSVGVGTTITINFGTYSSDLSTFTANPDASSVSIAVDPSSDSLTTICDAINAASPNVIASIVQDSGGSRLSLSSTQTGESYAMQVISDVAALNYDPTTSNTTLTQAMAPQNSVVLLNGMTLNQSSNQLENALTGISLNLQQANSSETISLTVATDQEQLTSSIHNFVKEYNECMTILNSLTGYDEVNKQAGYFQGDSQIKHLKSELFATIANFASASSTPGQSLTLADIGINTTKSSMLEIDKETFNTAVSKNFSSIGALFAKSIMATDPSIQVNGIDTRACVGAYDVFLSEFTPGVSMSGTIGGLPATSTDGVTLIGSGNLSSLSISVLAGTAGARGQIIVNEGLAVAMDQIVNNYIGKHGAFERRAESLDKEISQLAKTQKQIDAHSIELEKMYLKKWNAVDLLISNSKDTSKMVSQLLETLPKLKIKS